MAPLSNNLICLSCVPKVLNEDPVHTNGFFVFCNSVESGFMARVYELCSLTRNSHDTGPCWKHWWPGPQWQFQFHWQWPARSDPLRMFIALWPANCPAAACRCFSTWVQSDATASQGSFKTWTTVCHRDAGQDQDFCCGKDQDFLVRARLAKWPGKHWGRSGARAGMSDTSRQVTLPSTGSAVILEYNFCQREQ